MERESERQRERETERERKRERERGGNENERMNGTGQPERGSRGWTERVPVSHHEVPMEAG